MLAKWARDEVGTRLASRINSRDTAGDWPRHICMIPDARLRDWSDCCGSSMWSVTPVWPVSQLVSSGARSDNLIQASFWAS